MNAPSLSRVLELAVQGALDDVRVALPGRVVAYDATRQRADIQPLIKDGHDTDDGRVVESVPVVCDVPVAFPGAGGYSETFPIARGDTVLLVFCSSSIARWKATGAEVDPGDDRHHALSDAIAYAGVRAAPITGVPTDAWVITVPTGKQLRLGAASASQAVIRGDAFRSSLDILLTALDTFAGTVPGGGGGALVAAINAFKLTWNANLSAKVKVA